MENNEEGEVKKIEDMKYEEITETIRKSLTMMRGYVEEVSKAIEKYLEALDRKYIEIINAKSNTVKKEEQEKKQEKPKQRYKQITF